MTVTNKMIADELIKRGKSSDVVYLFEADTAYNALREKIGRKAAKLSSTRGPGILAAMKKIEIS